MDTPITRLRNLMTPVVNYFALMKQFKGANPTTFIQVDLQKSIEVMPEIKEILKSIPSDACDVKEASPLPEQHDKNEVTKNEATQTDEKDCDCMEKLQENILKKANEDERNTDGYKIVESDWEHKSWYPKVRLYVNFLIKYTFKKKDGTTSKPRNEHMSIFFTYCPFCGKKYPSTKKL